MELSSLANNQHSKCKARTKKQRKTASELVQAFWSAPLEALFGQETIAPVVNRQIKTLECDRWRGKGIPYRKCAGRVLYRKSDVIAWLEGHELVSSTSEYQKKEVEHARL